MNPTQNTGKTIPEAFLLGCFKVAADGFPVLVRQPANTDSSEHTYTLTDAGKKALAAANAVQGSAPVDLVTETDDQAVSQVLRCAAIYLERHGWIQGAYFDPTATIFTPAADMVGALTMVCYGGPVEAPAQMFDHPEFLNFEQALLHLDRWLLVEDGTVAYEFNDARGRTADQVVWALRRAAAVPAAELIDALRIIDARNATTAALAEQLVPSGVFTAQSPKGWNGRACDCSRVVSGQQWPCVNCPGWLAADGDTTGGDGE